MNFLKTLKTLRAPCFLVYDTKQEKSAYVSAIRLRYKRDLKHFLIYIRFDTFLFIKI